MIAGFDRNALRLTGGGEETGSIAQHYIPPGVPGHDESGGDQGFEEFDWMRNPQGDPELAARYFRAAGFESGRYEGDRRLLTIAVNADPGRQAAMVAQGQFERLGFRLNFRQVPADTMFTKFCAVPSSKYAICPNIGWYKDFNDPQTLLEPTFGGEAIKPQGNSNVSLLDDDQIDRAMTEAALIPVGPERNQAWADINKLIVAQATGIPFAWPDSFGLWSSNVQTVMNPYLTTPDLAFTSLK